MSIPHSPVVTRSHASAAAKGDRTDVRNSEQETPGTVKALLEEMWLMRESLARREEEQAATLRRHEEKLRLIHNFTEKYVHMRAASRGEEGDFIKKTASSTVFLPQFFRRTLGKCIGQAGGRELLERWVRGSKFPPDPEKRSEKHTRSSEEEASWQERSTETEKGAGAENSASGQLCEEKCPEKPLLRGSSQLDVVRLRTRKSSWKPKGPSWSNNKTAPRIIGTTILKRGSSVTSPVYSATATQLFRSRSMY
ncbi:uncharacterized protein LOC118647091 [Monomorium pharaonis]|uniref:uncharacterized protein LOC118647091 n=1 Tax=Monomorium pharaonis TaxID=307658 RepID=UPI001747C8F2|nr:uncharacterized protein LOC118647091 [Monomorium pharaonis]